MTRRLRIGLVAGAVGVVGLALATTYRQGPGQAGPPVQVALTSAVGLAFLAAGFTAWSRWPATRLGFLFTLVGYLWMVPVILFNLPGALAFTVANVAQPLYQGALTQLALAWPSGRLRSRFERAVVITEYSWLVVNNVVGALFWNPRTDGCPTGCPANLLMVDGSNSGREQNCDSSHRD